MKSKTTALAAGLLTATATVGLALAGSMSASAGQAYAPPVTTSSDLSFVVPVTVDPLQTRVDVGGQIEDPYLTDKLADFAVSITCPGMTPVSVVQTSSSVAGDVRWGTIQFASLHAWLPKSEEGQTCMIHAASPANRKLVFGAPSTKQGEQGDTSRLYFSGSVILKSSNGGLG